MKSKRFEKYDLIGVILGIILIAIIGFTLYLCVRTFEKERGTAYADSTDGVVENNLFTVSTFDGLSGSTSSSMQLGTSVWYLSGSGSTTRSLSNNVLSSSAYAVSGVYAQLVTLLQNPTLHAGATFNFSCYGESLSYDWLLQVWYNDTNLPITVLSNTPYNTTSLKSITFTVPSTITSNGSIRLIVQTRGSVEVDWVKLEEGTSFTGYVPNDYTNYGYNQGFLDGKQDILDRQNLNVGVQILGSPYMVAYKYGGGQFDWFTDSAMWSSTTGGTYQQYIYAKGIDNFPPYAKNFQSPNNVLSPYLGTFFSLAGPVISVGPPQTFLFNTMVLDGSLFSTFTVNNWGEGFTSMLPLAFEVEFIGQPLYLTSDVTLLSSSYRILCTSLDLTYFSFIELKVSGTYNGVRVVDLTSFLSKGQSYNFYLIPTSSATAISVRTKNSYFSGIDSLCIFTINDSYTIGVNNYNAGYEDGQKEGYSSGYNFGYDAGHRDGVLDNTDYSFTGLFGAVFDAPIKAFSGLLDFNLLGVNLKSFVLALLSLSVIVIVIKIALGGS